MGGMQGLGPDVHVVLGLLRRKKSRQTQRKKEEETVSKVCRLPPTSDAVAISPANLAYQRERAGKQVMQGSCSHNGDGSRNCVAFHSRLAVIVGPLLPDGWAFIFSQLMNSQTRH